MSNRSETRLRRQSHEHHKCRFARLVRLECAEQASCRRMASAKAIGILLGHCCCHRAAPIGPEALLMPREAKGSWRASEQGGGIRTRLPASRSRPRP